MDNEKIREFYTRLSRNDAFKDDLITAKEKYKLIEDPTDKFLKIINEVVIPRAKEEGLTLSAEDFLAYEKQAADGGELDLDALEGVSGGFNSFVNICLSTLMSVSSMASAGASLLSTVSNTSNQSPKPMSSFSETLKSEKSTPTDTSSATMKKAAEAEKKSPLIETYATLEKAAKTENLDADYSDSLLNWSGEMSDEVKENEDMAEAVTYIREKVDHIDRLDVDSTDSATAENVETPPLSPQGTPMDMVSAQENQETEEISPLEEIYSILYNATMEEKISENDKSKILEWCDQNQDSNEVTNIKEMIKKVETMERLRASKAKETTSKVLNTQPSTEIAAPPAPQTIAETTASSQESDEAKENSDFDEIYDVLDEADETGNLDEHYRTSLLEWCDGEEPDAAQNEYLAKHIKNIRERIAQIDSFGSDTASVEKEDKEKLKQQQEEHEEEKAEAPEGDGEDEVAPAPPPPPPPPMPDSLNKSQTKENKKDEVKVVKENKAASPVSATDLEEVRTKLRPTETKTPEERAAENEAAKTPMEKAMAAINNGGIKLKKASDRQLEPKKEEKNAFIEAMGKRRAVMVDEEDKEQEEEMNRQVVLAAKQENDDQSKGKVSKVTDTQAAKEARTKIAANAQKAKAATNETTNPLAQIKQGIQLKKTTTGQQNEEEQKSRTSAEQKTEIPGALNSLSQRIHQSDTEEDERGPTEDQEWE